jgi:two-component system, OmpR family, sensor histidine kinase CiaH
MSQTLKPYEELVIASDHNIFLRVRLKLTSVYVVIIACILLGYNTINYLDLRHDLAEAKLYKKETVELTEVPGHAETLQLLVWDILVEDAFILSFAAWFSYLFAGYTLKPVQKSLVAQRTFAENASHELRTPLAVMRSDAEVLLRNPHPEEGSVKATLQSVIEEIDRMTVMTNDLLLLARSEHKNASDKKSINLIDVLDSMTKKVSSLAEGKGVKLTFDQGSTSYVISGDISALERVFLNLLQNAITHTPQHGSISISLKKEMQQVVISCKDTGRGISTKDVPHVFERFYKGVESQGTGLGLPIVKEIIESHDGKVSIRSEIGRGTEVLIRLPYMHSRDM